MNEPISYGKLLFYHFIVGLIGFTVSMILFGAGIIRNITSLSNMFLSEEIVEYDFSGDFLLQIFTLVGLMVLAALITKFICAGLSYIPYLYYTNNLSVKSILLTSLKRGYGVILYSFVIGIVLGGVSGLLTNLPIIGFIAPIAIGYPAGLLYLWLDYHLSRNALHNKGIFADLTFNINQLFKHPRKEREVFIMPIYFMLVNIVGLANLFIMPLFQKRIIEILDDERNVNFSPPPSAIMSYPPNPPQSIE